MQSLKNILEASVLGDIDTTISDMDNSEVIKVQNGLNFMKSIENKVRMKQGNLKQNSQTDMAGNKLEAGDYVIFGDDTGGWGNKYYINAGVIVSFYDEHNYKKCLINIYGDYKPDEFAEGNIRRYCNNVLKTTPTFIKKMYK